MTREYDGSENKVLAANVRWLGSVQTGQLLLHLAIENMRIFPAACVDLLSRLTRESGLEPAGGWLASLREIAAAIVGVLPYLKQRQPDRPDRDWWRTQKEPAHATTVADLLETLAALNASTLRDAACKSMVANPKVLPSAEYCAGSFNS